MQQLSISEIVSAVDGKLLWEKENKVLQVSTNSKDSLEHGLFVPLVGEKVDAHKYMIDAIKQGAVAVFTSKHVDLEAIKEDTDLKYEENKEILNQCSIIYVADTKRALQDLAAYYRSLFDLPIIGISGSVGKTTTKEMISAALETQYKVLKTFGNMNSQVGVALMMFQIERDHDVAVIEMGISEPGEMEHLTRIAKPKYAVLTNIGVSHIANLKTRENIRKEKSNIVNAFTKDSILYVNGNDELLAGLSDDWKEGHKSGIVDLSDITNEKLSLAKVTTFGTLPTCEYQGDEVINTDHQSIFTLKYPKGSEKITLSVFGIHNVYNALVALALADELGIPLEVAKVGLEKYQPLKMRGEICEVNGIKIIDDTYNASPDSMKSGIEVLLSLAGVKRRIAVLADVLELGDMSRSCHYGVGEYLVDKKIDLLITVGKEAAYIAMALKDRSSSIKTISYGSNQTAIEYLKDYLKPGDGLLVKGSRGMHTEEIVQAFLGNSN